MKLGLILCLLVCSVALGGKKVRPIKGKPNGVKRLKKCLIKHVFNLVKNKDVDVMELMDHSGSLTPADYDYGVSALKDINKIINIASAAPGIQGGHPASGSRVGYVKFSHPQHTKVMVFLDEVNDLAAINNKIDIPFDDGNRTAMTTALELANTEFAKYSRLPTNRHKIVLLVTDGWNNIGGDSVSAADTLKSWPTPWETTICVLEVGNSNINKLNQIASMVFDEEYLTEELCRCSADTYQDLLRATRLALKKARKMVRKRNRKNMRKSNKVA